MKKTKRWLAMLLTGLLMIPSTLILNAEELTDNEFEIDMLGDGVEDFSEPLFGNIEMSDTVDQLEDSLLFDGNEIDSLVSETPENSLTKINSSYVAGYIKTAVLASGNETIYTANYDYDLENGTITIDMIETNGSHDFILPFNRSPYAYENPIGLVTGFQSEAGFSQIPLIMDGTIVQIIVKHTKRIDIYRFNASEGRVYDYTRTVYKRTESGEPGEVVIVIPINYEYDNKGRLVKINSSYDSNACTDENWEYLPDYSTSYSFIYDKDDRLTSYYKMNDGPYPGDIAGNGKFEIYYHDESKIEIVHDMYYDISSSECIFVNKRLTDWRQKWGKDYTPIISRYIHDEWGRLCRINFNTNWYYELSYYDNYVTPPTPTPNPTASPTPSPTPMPTATPFPTPTPIPLYNEQTTVTVYNSVKGADIRWETVKGATAYKVYRKRGIEGTKKVGTFTNSNTTQYYDSEIKDNCWGRVYNYYVVPVVDNQKGPQSDDAVLQRLAPMTITSVKNTTAEKATVSWRCSVNTNKANGYELQYATSKADLFGQKGSFKKVSINGRNNLTKTINGLTKGKTYYFRIRAYVNYTHSVTKKTTKTWSQYSNLALVKVTK